MTRQIRITDFHRLRKPVPAFLWVIALHHLRDVMKSAVRARSNRGTKVGCFGCNTYIETGERYHVGNHIDRRDHLGLHADGCAPGLLKKARTLDRLNKTTLCEHIFAPATSEPSGC